MQKVLGEIKLRSMSGALILELFVYDLIVVKVLFPLVI